MHKLRKIDFKVIRVCSLFTFEKSQIIQINQNAENALMSVTNSRIVNLQSPYD